MTLVDTNVLVDVLSDDARWAAWSVAQLDAALLHGPLLINSVVYAELAVRYERIEDLAHLSLRPGCRSSKRPTRPCFSLPRHL